jgi:glutathione S-transferase
MKLYDATFPGTRASRVRWMLEECGAKYEVAPLDPMKGEHKAKAYLEIHPHGLLPGAEVDGEPMIESAAICMHLADTHAEKKLAPAVGTAERARWYQWIVYAVATLDEPIVGAVLHAQVLPPERRKPELVEKGKQVWNVAGPFLERSLAKKEWILGERFTCADVVLGYDVAIAARLGWVEPYPAVAAYAGRLTSRPAFRKAYGG